MPPGINISTTTNQYLAPKWVDQVLRDNFFFGEILSKTKKWDGSQMLFPIKYQKGVPSIAFSGFDLLPINQQVVSVNMSFYPSFVATNVALSGTDLSVNNTEKQTIKLMEVMMESRSQDMADSVGDFFYGDQTAFGGKAPAGLGNIVDDGSVASTYGGLSRATYAGLNATVTPSGGTISLLKIRQLANSISDGKVFPDMALTDYTTWSYVEQLLMAFQRNTYTDFVSKNPMSSKAGYRGLIWDGIEIYKDKKAPTGTFFLLNTDFLDFYGLKWFEGKSMGPKAKDIEGNVYEYLPNVSSAFTWTDWIRAYNQGAINGFMIMGGQLICRSPFRNGKLTGVNGI